MVHALRTWRHYLLGLQFTAYTDHHSIIHFFSQPHLSRRQARWSELLADFDVKIEYKSGAKNIVADALSRRKDPTTIAAITSIHNTILEEVRQAPKDNDYLFVQQLLSDPNNPISHTYQLHQGLLYNLGRLYIPSTLPKLCQQLLTEYHDSPTAGHLGVSKTQLALLLARNEQNNCRICYHLQHMPEAQVQPNQALWTPPLP